MEAIKRTLECQDTTERRQIKGNYNFLFWVVHSLNIFTEQHGMIPEHTWVGFRVLIKYNLQQIYLEYLIIWLILTMLHGN
jgi:hypothetical protein